MYTNSQTCDWNRDSDWRIWLKNFDAVFGQAQASNLGEVQPSASEVDLGQENSATTARVEEASGDCETPPAMTKADFEKAHPETEATITLNVGGQNIMCHCVAGKCFVTSPAKTHLVGLASASPAPVFMYAGGSWLSDSAKVELLTKMQYVPHQEWKQGSGIPFGDANDNGGPA